MHSKREQARRNMMWRRIVSLSALAVILGVVIFFIATRGSGDNDPVIVAASVEPTAEPTAEPVSEPVSEPTPEITPEALPNDAPEPLATAEPVNPANGLRSVHIRVTGDMMFHTEQLSVAKQPDGTYDFHSQFQYIAPSLAAADYTIANLETTVGKSAKLGYSGYPQFNTPESVLETLRDCGIDFFTMANNHMLDRYFDGLKKDVELVEKYGFDHVGAYRTREERYAPVIYEVNGIKLGFVAYTHTTNTLERYSDKEAGEYGVPWLYKADFNAEVKTLRDAGAEVVIALPHWGTENVATPDSDQEKYAKRLAAAGVDIILGSHSHMVERMEVIEGVDADGKPRQLFLIYSMGNFISSMTMKHTDCGIILDFTIQEQPGGGFRVEKIGYVPIYVWKENYKLTVLPSGKYLNNRPSGMSDSEYNNMRQSYEYIINHLGTNGFTVLSE